MSVASSRTTLIMVTIQILSDLHLEAPQAYDVFEIVPKARHLALLGDIGNVVKHKTAFLAFLTKQLRQFSTVLFVPGNHEAYHSTWPATLATLQALEADVGKDASLGAFVLLDRRAYQVPDTDVVLLGCSLFSLVPPTSEADVGLGLNDFYHTGGAWDVPAHNDAHRRDLAWLNAQAGALARRGDVARVAVLSHWSPSTDPRAVDPRHRGGGSRLASAFATDLSGEPCFAACDKVRLWAFGHTHFNCDFLVQRGGQEGERGSGGGGMAPLRLLANQRGYYFAPAQGFDGEKTVEV